MHQISLEIQDTNTLHVMWGGDIYIYMYLYNCFFNLDKELHFKMKFLGQMKE